MDERGLDEQDDGEAMITLVSMEQERYSIPKRVAMMSNMIKKMVEGSTLHASCGGCA